jgi:hypothetical protein
MMPLLNMGEGLAVDVRRISRAVYPSDVENVLGAHPAWCGEGLRRLAWPQHGLMPTPRNGDVARSRGNSLCQLIKSARGRIKRRTAEASSPARRSDCATFGEGAAVQASDAKPLLSTTTSRSTTRARNETRLLSGQISVRMVSPG